MAAIRRIVVVLMAISPLLFSCCRSSAPGIEQTPLPNSSEISAQFPLEQGTYWIYEGPTKESEGDSG